MRGHILDNYYVYQNIDVEHKTAVQEQFSYINILNTEEIAKCHTENI